LTFNEVFDLVLSSNVVIYSIALVDPLALDHNPRALRRLADGTGGLAFQPDKAADIGRALHSIARDIRSRYTLAYAPDQINAAGQLRRIRVTVDAPGHSGLKVRTRTGYVTTPSSRVSNAGEVAR
jgi:VWFA-related protein